MSKPSCATYHAACPHSQQNLPEVSHSRARLRKLGFLGCTVQLWVLFLLLGGAHATAWAQPTSPAAARLEYLFLPASGARPDTDSIQGRFAAPAGTERVPVAPRSFAAWLRELPLLLDSYRNTRRAGRGEDAQFEILDGVQRLSAGVASLPNLRFWVLLAGDHQQAAGAASGGEWIVELKEERDPPQPVAWLGRGPIGDNGQRVFVGTLALLASPSSEPDLGYVKRGGVSFQVRRVLRGRRDLDVERLTDRLRSGRYGASDCLDLATTLGQLLAAGHGRRAKAYAIATAIAEQEDQAGSFADSLAQAAAIDAQRLERDLLLFGRALVQLGPLLSARRN